MAPTIHLPSFRHLDPDNPENQFGSPPSRYQQAPRTLPPPLPPQNLTHAFPHPDTFTNRALTHGTASRFADAAGGSGGTSYALTTDANMMIASRHMHSNRSKDVKRRTKTGCMTCRKRRIKVRGELAVRLSIFLGCVAEGQRDGERGQFSAAWQLSVAKTAWTSATQTQPTMAVPCPGAWCSTDQDGTLLSRRLFSTILSLVLGVSVAFEILHSSIHSRNNTVISTNTDTVACT